MVFLTQNTSLGHRNMKQHNKVRNVNVPIVINDESNSRIRMNIPYNIAFQMKKY